MGCGYGKLGISSEGDDEDCQQEEGEEEVHLPNHSRKNKRQRRRRRSGNNKKQQTVSEYKGGRCPPEKERERLQHLSSEQEPEPEQEEEEAERGEGPQRPPQRNGLLQPQDKKKLLIGKIKISSADSPIKPQMSRSDSQMDFFRMLDEKIARGKDYESDQDNDLADGRWRMKENSQSPPLQRTMSHDPRCPSVSLDTDAASSSPGDERRKRSSACFCATVRGMKTCSVSSCN